MYNRYPCISKLGDLLSTYFQTGKAVSDPELTACADLFLDQLRGWEISTFAAAALGMPLENQPGFNMERTYVMLLQADELSKKLLDCEIPHTFIRGAYLSSFYPHPQLRTFSDLDLLIHPAYLRKTLSIILSLGAHTAARDQTSFSRGYWDGIQLFIDKPRKILVELHIDLAPLKRFPNPHINQPPIADDMMLAVQALAVILHSSTHHYQSPLRAMLDIMVLSAKGMDWKLLGELISRRQAWHAILPFLADLEDFAPGIVPHSLLKHIKNSSRCAQIRKLADKINQSGGVYGRGNLHRRSLLTMLTLPDVEHALGALMRGLGFRLIQGKIET